MKLQELAARAAGIRQAHDLAIGADRDAIKPQLDAAEKALLQAGMQLADDVTDRLREAGLVLTVEQTPLQPLAMGNYTHTISVRLARRPA